MDCSKVKYLISEYVENNLCDDHKRGLELHLSFCEECSNDLKELQNYKKLIDNAEKINAPSDFEEKIFDKLKTNKKELPLFGLGFRSKIVKSLALAAAILLFFLFDPFNLASPPSIEFFYIEKSEKSTQLNQSGRGRGKSEKTEKASEKSLPKKSEKDKRFNENFDNLKKLIIKNNGVLLKEYVNENTNQNESLYFNLPRKKFKMFILAVDSFGDFSELPVKAPFSFHKKVLVRIDFKLNRN